MLKKEINFFGGIWNSYGLAKLAIFWKFSTFLFDLDFYVEVRYRHYRPHFRIARFTSYNFYFGCLNRWVEKVGQKNCSIKKLIFYKYKVFLIGPKIDNKSKNRFHKKCYWRYVQYAHHFTFLIFLSIHFGHGVGCLVFFFSWRPRRDA